MPRSAGNIGGSDGRVRTPLSKRLLEVFSPVHPPEVLAVSPLNTYLQGLASEVVHQGNSPGPAGAQRKLLADLCNWRVTQGPVADGSTSVSVRVDRFYPAIADWRSPTTRPARRRAQSWTIFAGSRSRPRSGWLLAMGRRTQVRTDTGDFRPLRVAGCRYGQPTFRWLAPISRPQGLSRRVWLRARDGALRQCQLVRRDAVPSASQWRGKAAGGGASTVPWLPPSGMPRAKIAGLRPATGCPPRFGRVAERAGLFSARRRRLRACWRRLSIKAAPGTWVLAK